MSRRRRGVIRQCVIDNDFAGRAKRARTAIDEIISGLGVAMHRPSTIEEGGERRLRRMSGQELAKTLEWLRQKPIEGLTSVLSRLSNCVHTADAIVPEWCGIQDPVEMATGVFSVGRNYQGTGNRGGEKCGRPHCFFSKADCGVSCISWFKRHLPGELPFYFCPCCGHKKTRLFLSGEARFECQLLLSGSATACRPELPRRSCCRR